MKAAPHHVHTEGNAVPPLDEQLADLIDGLRGTNPGLDQIADGLQHLALQRHTTDQTQTTIARLAGNADDDAIAVIGHLIARLTNADSNPGLRTLPLDLQKKTQHEGEDALFALTDRHIHQPAAEAAGSIDGL